MKFITHIKYIESGRKTGWQVRIPKTPNSPKLQKKSYTKYFPHLAYGGERESLKAAKKYRDEIAVKCGRDKEKIGQSTSRGRYTDYKTNGTGISGITYEIGGKGEFPSEAYVVNWTEDAPGGKRKSRNKRFGWGAPRCKYNSEAQAFKAAKALREEMVKLHYTGRRKLDSE